MHFLACRSKSKPISYPNTLFKQPVKKVNVNMDVLWKRGKIIRVIKVHKSDFCLSGFALCHVCVAACLHEGRAKGLISSQTQIADSAITSG